MTPKIGRAIPKTKVIRCFFKGCTTLMTVGILDDEIAYCPEHQELIFGKGLELYNRTRKRNTTLYNVKKISK